jgi:hypothetical protein
MPNGNFTSEKCSMNTFLLNKLPENVHEKDIFNIAYFKLINV